MQRLEKKNRNTARYWNEIYSKPEMNTSFEKDPRYLLLAHFVRERDVVLDLGCGDGGQSFVIKLVRPLASVFGVDLSERGVEKARQFFGQHAEFSVGKAQKVDFPDGFFDTVICGELIEHLEKPEALFKEIARILRKEGGKLVLSTPYREYESPFSSEHLWAWDGDDLKEMAEGYFKEVWFLPWASGRMTYQGANGKIIRGVGEEDFIILLAKK